jgi:hypothetical protein
MIKRKDKKRKKVAVRTFVFYNTKAIIPINTKYPPTRNLSAPGNASMSIPASIDIIGPRYPTTIFMTSASSLILMFLLLHLRF